MEKHAGKIYYFFADTKMKFSKPSKLALWVGVQTCLNMNWTTWSADSGQIFHLFIFLMIYNYKLLKAFLPKHL